MASKRSSSHGLRDRPQRSTKSSNQPTSSKPPSFAKPAAPHNRTRNLQREYRLSLGGNTRSQKTLTQINFVCGLNPPPLALDDRDFKLIEETYAPEEDDSHSKELRQEKSDKKDLNTQSDNRNQSTFKPLVNVDWSLHQQSHPASASLDNEKYRPTTRRPSMRNSRKRSAYEMEAIQEESENDADLDTHRDKRPKPTIPLKVNTNPSSYIPPPITPQKPRKWVVPSSQSPDSPEITLITPRKIVESPIHFRLPRTPRTPRSLTSQPQLIRSSPVHNNRRDSPTQSVDIVYDSQIIQVENSFAINNDDDDDDQILTAQSSPLSSVRSIHEVTESFTESLATMQSASTTIKAIPQTPTLPDRAWDRRVINETDDESCPESFYNNNMSQIRENRLPKQIPADRMLATDELMGNSSQPPVSQLYDDSVDGDLGSLGSDISLLYTRRPIIYAHERFPYTQLNATISRDNHPPIQGMEIAESEGWDYGNPSSPSAPRALHSDDHTIPTEPILGHKDDQPSDEESQKIPETTPSSPVIIQVESSQQLAQDDSQADDAARLLYGFETITASQLLTESLMESIPGPRPWITLPDPNDIEEDTVDTTEL
ncbi:hypothetical protein FQN57_000590 [Myotisia sp. PD_48]|nr:hypothetical protein FQN57_000590 [Myotisia sp. PD_48]